MNKKGGFLTIIFLLLVIAVLSGIIYVGGNGGWFATFKTCEKYEYEPEGKAFCLSNSDYPGDYDGEYTLDERICLLKVEKLCKRWK